MDGGQKDESPLFSTDCRNEEKKGLGHVLCFSDDGSTIRE